MYEIQRKEKLREDRKSTMRRCGSRGTSKYQLKKHKDPTKTLCRQAADIYIKDNYPKGKISQV
jgi:hypothetical protein